MSIAYNAQMVSMLVVLTTLKSGWKGTKKAMYQQQKVAGSTLQIPRGEKVPATLIKKIIKERVKINGAK